MTTEQGNGADPQIALQDPGGADWPDRFSEFLETYGDEDRAFNVSVFEMKRRTPNAPEKPEYLKNYPGEIPSYDDVARYGPGKYRLVLRYVPRGKSAMTTKSVTIYVSEKYEPEPEPADQSLALVAPGSAPAPGGDLFAQVLAMQSGHTQQIVGIMQMFMTTIGEILGRRFENEGQSMGTMQKALNEVILSNVDQQQALVSKLLGTKYGVDMGQEDRESGEGKTFFDFVKDLFYTYGDQILNAGPVMQKLFRKQVNESEDFALIEENPDLYKAAYDDILAEDPGNKGKLDNLLKILGAPDPDLLLQATRDAQTGAAPEQAQ